MKPTEGVKLVRAIKALCPAQHVDTLTPDTWAIALADLTLDDCLNAVHAIARRQPFISASDVVTQVRETRARRVQDTRMPAPPPELADNPDAYLAWLRAASEAIAMGRPAAEVTSRSVLPPRRPRTLAGKPRRLELEAGR